MNFTNLLIVDCKTTVWENNKSRPAGHTDDIIALDIALIDTIKNQIVENDSLLVKPRISKISAYCEKLFGISQSFIDRKGIPFEEAYRKLRVNYMSRDQLWGSWGIYDKYSLDKQCKALSLESPFTQPHHNIQHWYALMTGEIAYDYVSLSDALKQSNIPSVENKAINVANIFINMAKGLRPPVKQRILVPSGYSRFN